MRSSTRGLFGLPIVQHCEDRTLSAGAPMHEGAVSTRLGMSGQPAIAEAAAVARDLLVAELTRGRLHVAHLSTARAVELVRRAKAEGVAVTCEVTPHHLVLTDEEVATSGFSTRTKMNPPLREASDLTALVAGLLDGTIDAIATDHAPHHADEKAVDFDSAPFGIVGLETAASVVHDRLVARGRLGLRPVRCALLGGAGPRVRPAGGHARAGLAGGRHALRSRRPLEGRSAQVRLEGAEHAVRRVGACPARRRRRSWGARSSGRGSSSSAPPAAVRPFSPSLPLALLILAAAGAPAPAAPARRVAIRASADVPRTGLDRLAAAARARGVEVDLSAESAAVPPGFDLLRLSTLPPSDTVRAAVLVFPVAFQSGGLRL